MPRCVEMRRRGRGSPQWWLLPSLAPAPVPGACPGLSIARGEQQQGKLRWQQRAAALGGSARRRDGRRAARWRSARRRCGANARPLQRPRQPQDHGRRETWASAPMGRPRRRLCAERRGAGVRIARGRPKFLDSWRALAGVGRSRRRRRAGRGGPKTPSMPYGGSSSPGSAPAWQGWLHWRAARNGQGAIRFEARGRPPGWSQAPLPRLGGCRFV